MTDETTRVALITGGGSGIGRSSALGLLRPRLDRRADRSADGTPRGNAADGRRRRRADPRHCQRTSPILTQSRRCSPACARNTGGWIFSSTTPEAEPPPLPLEDLTLEQWQRVVDLNLTGAFLCTQEAFRIMKDQNPRGGRIIKQRLDLGRPARGPKLLALHRDQARADRVNQGGRAGWPQVRHRLRADRYRQRADRDDVGAWAGGVPQPNGERMQEPTFDVEHVADAIVYMAGLPLDANVPFITVMATKMPLFGRG